MVRKKKREVLKCPSVDDELLEGSISIERALKCLEESENNPDSIVAQRKPNNKDLEPFTPPLKAPVPLVSGKLKKIVKGGLHFSEMHKSEFAKL